jgi:hypothetical protein
MLAVTDLTEGDGLLDSYILQDAVLDRGNVGGFQILGHLVLYLVDRCSEGYEFLKESRFVHKEITSYRYDNKLVVI